MVDQPRQTQRYQHRVRDNEPALVEEILKLNIDQRFTTALIELSVPRTSVLAISNSLIFIQVYAVLLTTIGANVVCTRFGFGLLDALRSSANDATSKRN